MPAVPNVDLADCTRTCPALPPSHDTNRRPFADTDVHDRHRPTTKLSTSRGCLSNKAIGRPFAETPVDSIDYRIGYSQRSRSERICASQTPLHEHAGRFVLPPCQAHVCACIWLDCPITVKHERSSRDSCRAKVSQSSMDD